MRAEAPAIAFAPPSHLGDVLLGAEPSVAVAPDGTVYVGSPGYALYRSDDAGATWKGVGPKLCLGEVALPKPAADACPISGSDPGKQGGGDTSLAVAPDGTLELVGLGGYLGTSAGNIPFQTSRDKGETLSRAVDLAPSAQSNADRPWIARDEAGRLHASWRDSSLGKVVVRSSPDDGATWGPSVNVSADSLAGPLAMDPASGALYLPRVGDDATLAVSRSLDGGVTWTSSRVLPLPAGTDGFPVVAVDGAGVVYLAYSTDPSPRLPGTADGPIAIPQVFLLTSHDGGRTWSAPSPASPAGVPAVFPWIVAGDAGRIALAWYEGLSPTPSDRLPNVWHVAVALSLDGGVTLSETDASGPLDHVGGICQEGSLCPATAGDRSMLDFFEMRLLPDGRPILAYAGDSVARPAYVAVFATRMIEGPSLRG